MSDNMDLADFLTEVRDLVLDGRMPSGRAEVSATVRVKHEDGTVETYDVPNLVLDTRRGDLLVTSLDTPVEHVPGVPRVMHTGATIVRLAASLHLEPDPEHPDRLYTLTRKDPE